MKAFFHNKIVKAVLIVLGVLVGAAAVAGAVIGIMFASVETGKAVSDTRHIVFQSKTAMVGDYAITAPASGSTKRNVTAVIYEREDKTDGKILEDTPVTYSLDREVKGVTLEGNLLTVSSELEEDVTLKVTAKDAGPDGAVYVTRKIQLKKDPALKDVPANPQEKDGWTLVYHDEFDGNALDYTKWSPFYMRHWVDNDERTRTGLLFEDGSVVLRCDEDMPSWSSQNSSVKVRALMSYERNHLHKYGEVGSGAVFNRDIPVFDGYATKYGYFEVRMRMPDTNDGSHFAWWMVGTQDDQNSTATLGSELLPMAGHHSNETGEIDIIETYLSPLESMKNWRPVIHPNGTTDYEYHWLDAYTIPGDPSREYHVYGFEWDESGTKFYVDGQLASQSDRSPNYRMMTFLSTYATGGMGTDQGIYPKDAYIDYFRVYKKNTQTREPESIVLNDYVTPDFIRVPDTGSTAAAMKAYALDQFDQPIDAQIKWKLSQTVDGLTPETAPSAQLTGVSIDAATGTVTVTSEAALDQDVFVMAYVDNHIKQTYAVRLSKDQPRDGRLLFHAPVKTVAPGSVTDCSAVLYDQYGKARADAVIYQLSEDISAQKAVSVPGVSIGSDGKLSVDTSVKPGTVLVVTAKSGSRYNNLCVKVQ